MSVVRNLFIATASAVATGSLLGIMFPGGTITPTPTSLVSSTGSTSSSTSTGTTTPATTMTTPTPATPAAATTGGADPSGVGADYHSLGAFPCSTTAASVGVNQAALQQAISTYLISIGSVAVNDPNLNNLAAMDMNNLAFNNSPGSTVIVYNGTAPPCTNGFGYNPQGVLTLMQRVLSNGFCRYQVNGGPVSYNAIPTAKNASEIIFNGCYKNNLPTDILSLLEADPVAQPILADPQWDHFGVGVVGSSSRGIYWGIIMCKEN
jgi:hypothetical protein